MKFKIAERPVYFSTADLYAERTRLVAWAGFLRQSSVSDAQMQKHIARIDWALKKRADARKPLNLC